MNSIETDNLRVERFDRAFKRISHREHWLKMYLSLRDEGDGHLTAVETIRGEMIRETMAPKH